MGEVMDFFAEQKIKRKIEKLQNCRKDLNDDSGAVNAINKNFESLIDDLQSFIGTSGSAPIENRLREMKEHDQGCDNLLGSARNEIDKEIYYLRRGLKDSGGSCK